MSQAARYLFDLDFAAPPEPEVEELIEEIPPEPMITVAEHERLLAQAKAEAFAEGEKKATENREHLASEQNVALQKQLIEEISMVYAEVGLLMQRLERDASQLAFAFASRFAERLVAQEPKGEIMALLNQILAPLRKTPHISIRLNDAVADDIKTAVDQQMSELGFTGNLTILPDPVVMPGDCEVEWVDGGIGRNLRTAIRQVEQLLEDHFAHVPDAPEDEQDEDAQDEAAQDEAAQDEAVQDETAENQDNEEQQEQADPSSQTGDEADMTSPAAETEADANTEQAAEPEIPTAQEDATPPAMNEEAMPVLETENDARAHAEETPEQPEDIVQTQAAAPNAKGEGE
ncbi:FliH/SctL family protein [uncultured Cohaesibacter sp.]|uniref:FliH/SctL family protein n=1 Tax=uncultured Cohaesibacter sp. TaxID=1002546 RepID=UPI0029C7B072|nr:FliH/SctL family protein [uncultured Cohaesibacter sp.]